MRPDWHYDAACQGHNNVFFGTTASTGKALALCAGCPVVQPCLEAALAVPVRDDYGVWGMTTRWDRLRLRRARRSA